MLRLVQRTRAAPPCWPAAALTLTRESLRWYASFAARKEQRRWGTAEERRKLLADAAARLGVAAPEDWRNVTAEELKEKGCGELLASYPSKSAMLRDNVADWAPVRYSKSYFSVRENRRAFLDEMRVKYGIEKAEEWQKVRVEDFRRQGGRTLLPLFDSVEELLADTYPEMDVAQARCRSYVPRGHWRKMENQRQFVDSVAARHDVRKAEDWKKVRFADFEAMGGRSLLSLYGNSVFRLLAAVYPEQELRELQCRASLPRGYWEKAENRRKFMEDVAERHNVQQASDWAKVKWEDIRALGGGGLLLRYRDNVFEAVRDIFPELEVSEEACRSRMQGGHWAKRENQRAFLDAFASRNGIAKQEDWATVTKGDIEKAGGIGLLAHFSSVLEMLETVYEEERWDPVVCRTRVPPSYWESDDNVKSFILRLEKEMQIAEKKDWYRVSVQQVQQQRGSGLLRRMSFLDALRLTYPEEEFDEEQYRKTNKRAAQRQLKVRLTDLTEEEVVEEYLHPRLKGEQKGSRLELDLYVPGLELGLEYQGEHHYAEIPFFGSVESYMARDEEKRRLCASSGIRLVEVPYWWDGKVESLAATIYAVSPSLLEGMLAKVKGEEKRARLAGLLAACAEGRASPVSATPPEGHQHRGSRLAGRNAWSPRQDPTGMLACEQFVGVRCVWDGKELATLAGRRLEPPAWWKEKMPVERELDGVLWAGYGAAVGAVAGVTKGKGEEAWRGTVFKVMDSPHRNAALEKRLEALREVEENSVVQVVPHVVVEGRERLAEQLEEVLARKGDGLLLRKPKGFYQYGQKETMQRLKRVQFGYAVVLGKAAGSRGLLVRVPSGKQQVLRCSETQYNRETPAMGSVVRVGHLGEWATTGRFKLPFLVNVCPDMDADGLAQA